MATTPGMATTKEAPRATVPRAGLQPLDGERQPEADQCTEDEEDSQWDGYRGGGTFSEKGRISVEGYAVARLPAEVIVK